KDAICRHITRGGQKPARSLTPPGIPGYEPPESGEHDAELARRMLEAAGYGGGSGIPRLEILYNTVDAHRSIAEKIQNDWAQIGVRVSLRNVEWQQYLTSVHQREYSIARA